jgi:hypothetical protein
LRAIRTLACRYVSRAMPALGPSFHRSIYGEPVPKQNYHQARKQRELARKTRQQEKQQRRATRPDTPGTDAGETPAETPAAPNPDSGSQA